MNRKDKIIIFSTIGGLGIAFLIYNKMRKKILYDEIFRSIGGGAIKFEDSDVWSPNFLIRIKATNRPYAEYSQKVVNEFAEKLHRAMKEDTWTTPFGIGTREDDIISVFSTINSKVGVAQVSSFYNAKYGRDLKNDLEGELNKNYLTRLGSIIASKPDVIYLN